MKIVRLASLALVAIFAMSLAVASSASAIGPLFLPTGQTFAGTSGTSKLVGAAGEVVTCQSDVSSGTITSSTLAGGVLVHFLGCSGETAKGEKCTVKSTNTTATNLILTNTLHGVLGLVLPVPASGSDVALVLLPVSGKAFVTLVGSPSTACVETTKVSGSVAGLAEPVGTLLLTGTLKFAQTSGVQNITEVDLTTGGSVKPELTAFGSTATEETTESITYSKATEVM
jgi:hypothetical protein